MGKVNGIEILNSVSDAKTVLENRRKKTIIELSRRLRVEDIIEAKRVRQLNSDPMTDIDNELYCDELMDVFNNYKYEDDIS